MSDTSNYEPLTSQSLPARLSSISSIGKLIGGDPNTWQVEEVGDGNLNLVFIARGPKGKLIVKQALPYVRLVGDSWPLPLDRAFFEYEVLTRQAQRDPGSVPKVFYFDREQALIVMEFFSPHVILRKKLIAGEKVVGLAEALGKFCARTAFRGSDFSMQTKLKKSDTALFQGNFEMMGITENLIFTDPYYQAEMNNHSDGLDPIVAMLREDVKLKSAAQGLFLKFTANTETLLHGDLHSGSVMCTSDETKVIDPEFGFYGPIGFDIGMLIANYLMAYFSQPGHRVKGDLENYQTWILKVIEDTVASFEAEFSFLWHSERTGILYPQVLFEDQGHSSEAALNETLNRIRLDALGICGIEMHRRTLSLAHNADFEEIEDVAVRSSLEARNLMMGRELVLGSGKVADVSGLIDMAHRHNKEIYL